MPDIQHTMGNDLTLSPTGGIATSSGTQQGQERVLRRLLTNTGDYLWALNYGAGLPAFVGNPAHAKVIQAVAQTQMVREAAVSRSPAPVVNVTAPAPGTVVLDIHYQDAASAAPVVLSLPLSG